MAIGTTPLFSKISGSAGPVDFRTRCNGKIEIGKKRIPANPQSTEQQNTRNAYGRLHELWQNAAWIDKTQYENIGAAYDISSWNAFLMRHLPIMRLNPVAYWPFVEGTGNTLHDFTTNKNHGTVYGAVWEQLENYDIPILTFDGIDDYVDINNSPSLNITDEITIILYLYIHEISNSGYFITKNNTSFDDIQYGIHFDETTNNLDAFLNGVRVEESQANSIYKGTKNHVTLRYDKTRVEFDINGVPAPIFSPYSASITPTNFSVNLGRRKPDNIYLKGTFFETCIFNKPISYTQNTHLYNTSRRFYGV